MFKDINRLVRNFFGFSHGEAKGFLLLLCLLVLLSLAYGIYKNLTGPGYTSYAEDQALLDSLIHQMELQEQEPAAKLAYHTDTEEELPYQLFSFDPNTLSADSLRLLGLPSWLAGRIDKYRQKGGSFRKKEDLLKIYGLTDSLYKQLAPYIHIRSRSDKTAGSQESFSGPGKAEGLPAPARAGGKLPERLDINRADSLELQRVKGIGPVLSGRIVRFRQKLGGFVSLDQLYEVWGLDSAVVSNMREFTYVGESFQPAILLINSATQEELSQHPYISPSQARLLIAYRQQHGRFQSADELSKIHTFSSDFVEKIAPYILLD